MLPGDIPPERAFGLLADETRLAIIQALWAATELDADGTVGQEASAVRFSDLFAALGIDDTGNFNYHLEKLRGHFVATTDGGYVLTGDGVEVARHALAEASRDASGGPPAPASGPNVAVPSQ